MARSVSTGTYISRGAPIADLGGSGTILLRFKPTWSSGDSAQHYIWEYFFTASFEFSFQKFSDNNIYVGWRLAGGDARITLADTGLFTAGVWGNWLIDWDQTADLTHIYLNNVLKGTSTAAFTAETGALTLYIGNNNIPNAAASGDIAEWARWDHVLDSTERADVQASGNPECAPTGLAHYVKILGDADPEPDEIGSEDLAVAAVSPQATHPTVSECLGPDLTVDPSAINATAAVPSPVVEMSLGISPTAINATAVVPSPLLASDPFAIAPSAIAAVVGVPSPALTYIIPKGLTVTITDRLATG